MMRGMNFENIQTGRTTRLVEQACQEARDGRAVYILVHGKSQVRLLQEKVQKTWERLWDAFGASPPHGIKVEAFAEHAHAWSWSHMCPKTNFHPNCRWLVDHTVIEEEILRVQEEMKRLAGHIGKLYPHTV